MLEFFCLDVLTITQSDTEGMGLGRKVLVHAVRCIQYLRCLIRYRMLMKDK